MQRRRGLLALIAVLTLAVPAGAGANAIYIADNGGSVLKMNPKSGKVRLLSDDPLLGTPGGITFARNGTLLVTDFGGGAILRVDPSNGNTTQVSNAPELDQPFDLVQDKDGTIYVGETGTVPSIVDVDPATGDADYFSEGSAHFDNPYGVDIGKHRRLYAADDSIKDGSITEVSLKTGNAKTLVKHHGLDTPTGLEMGPAGRIFIADYAAGPNDTGAYLKVNPKSASVDPLRKGNPIDETFGLDVTRDGTIWAADSSDSPNDRPAIYRLSANGKHFKKFHDADLVSPYGVVVGH
jgi:streptogramin lyase